MTTRKYSSRSQQTTLAANLTDSATSCTVVSGSALLGGASVSAGTTFTVVIDPDTALEEIVDVTVVSTNVLTITRGVENAGTGQAHSAGAAVRHMAIGRDFREANLHIEATGGYNDGTGAHTMHGIASGEGDVVGTLKTQTLTNKTLTAPTITNPSISGAGVDATITFEGATADAHETFLTVAEPTQDNTITLPNTTGTVVIANAAQTLTNKTIDMTGVTLTGLSSAGMSVSSATPKNYVDSILGSATSAATSAASAATSAASAATSAGSAETSAIASAASATTSASSATAATTSATSAAASATAAATSATSAAASATTAANSVATIAGYATSSANSATAAATSAASAATSAASAAASTSAAAASATAAATSATSAASSASAAATSASSAATSATSAATSATSAAASAASAAAAVAASFDAKGDLLAGTGAGAFDQLTVAATNGYALTVNSATATGLAWAAIDALPSQTGNAGKFLTTDATTASWAVVAGSLAQPNEPSSPSDGQIWIDTDGTALINQLLRWSKAPAGGTTTLSGNDDNSVPLTYSVGYEQVYQNGVLLSRGGDYTATNGSSISLTNASVTGDIFEVFAAQPVAISDVYTQAQANAAFINDSLLTTTGDTIYASGANTPARLGIGTTGQVLTVSGGLPTWATPAGGGKVLQVVQATQSTATTVASTSRTDTGLTASITPSSASSKILVMVSQPTTLFRFSDAIKGFVYLMRGSTDIVPSEQTPGFTFGGSSLAEVYTLWTYNYLDSPATTSSVTYKTQGRVSTVANSGVIYFQLQATNAPSTMILMEIGA